MDQYSESSDSAQSSDSDILVAVEGLSRRYGSIQVVDQLSFTLARGQILGLLGLNGAGKSTTLRMLAGVLAPDAGRITIAGADLLDQPQQARKAIGYLPEQPPLYAELTVDEQLHYSARLHRLDRAAARQATARVKERCGLTDVGQRLTGQLSKGYRQRVGIAQALLHDPAVVILDEPTVGLDPVQAQEIRALIRALGAAHSVILSTHVLADVQAVCSHAQILRAGRLVAAGALVEWSRQEASTSLRIGLHAPPSVAELARVPGVERVEPLGAGRFRLHHAAGDAPSAALLEQAHSGGWALWELTPEQRGLEQRFVDVLLEEAAA